MGQAATCRCSLAQGRLPGPGTQCALFGEGCLFGVQFQTGCDQSFLGLAGPLGAAVCAHCQPNTHHWQQHRCDQLPLAVWISERSFRCGQLRWSSGTLAHQSRRQTLRPGLRSRPQGLCCSCFTVCFVQCLVWLQHASEAPPQRGNCSTCKLYSQCVALSHGGNALK